MYIGNLCQDCGTFFDEAVEKRYIRKNGEELDPPTYHCPKCGSDFIVAAEKCCICEEAKPCHDMQGNVCDDCIEKIENKIKDLIYRNCTVMEVEAAKEHLEIGGIL